MSWSFLTGLLEEIHNHSTFVGKLWLTVFIVFRIVLTAVGGESIYFDEQSNFVCNSGQPGCDNFCYNAFAPLSHVRFWIFQIILVATPSLMYLGYAMNKIARTEEEKAVEVGRPTPRKPQKIFVGGQQQHQRIEEAEDDYDEDPVIYEVPEKESRSKATPQEKQPETRHDGRQRIREDGLMCMYVLQLLARTLLEVGFLVGQYALYGLAVPSRYICTGKPCPHSVDCFVSRPTEKTVFLLIMYGVAVLCLALNVWEMLHLGVGTICDILHSHRSPTVLDESTDLSNVKNKQNRANVVEEEERFFVALKKTLQRWTHATPFRGRSDGPRADCRPPFGPTTPSATATTASRGMTVGSVPAPRSCPTRAVGVGAAAVTAAASLWGASARCGSDRNSKTAVHKRVLYQ